MQPVFNERALSYQDTLVLTDVHIGLEHEFSRSGVHIPPQTPILLKRIIELLDQTKSKQLLILGDLKHQIPYSKGREEIEVREFINILKQKTHVEIIRGNHDAGLEFLEVPLHPSSGIKIGDAGFFHGNAWPDEKLLDSKFLVMGHTHPAILLEDELKHRTRLPCWLRATFDQEKCVKKFNKEINAELIIMPAFNTLSGNIPVNSREKLLGPMVGLAKIDEADVYLLDGTHLGNVKDLKQDKA